MNKSYIYCYIFIFYYCVDKMLRLEQKNTALVIQIKEVTAQQMDRDKILDEFGAAIDTRISEWKVCERILNLIKY